MTSRREIPPAEADLQIKMDDFDRSEVYKATKVLNNYKAPTFDYNITAEAIKYGMDELTADTIKYIKDELTVRLLKLMNVIKNRQKPSKDGTNDLIIPIPKNGNLATITNCGGISLMSIIAKLYKLLINRIHGNFDAKLQINQTGYCPGWGCAEHIYFLRRILKGFDSKNLSLVAVLVDFKKALHSIDRNGAVQQNPEKES